VPLELEVTFISSSVLGHLRKDLYRDVVDIDTLAGDAIELTTRVEAALSRLSTDNFNLRAIINQNPEMTPADRTLTQQAEAELSNIVAQLDNMRNDEVYYRLQATIHNADQMNLVALKGNLSKGSFDELDHNIQALRARLEALSQIQI
ncbi:MAG TPA: hypothetical protein VFK03_00530, partial [Candidatus Saccharimonadales bacterium]|nr:hypothetical protein [Candidatus Saccharimonadales bacterium]